MHTFHCREHSVAGKDTITVNAACGAAATALLDTALRTPLSTVRVLSCRQYRCVKGGGCKLAILAAFVAFASDRGDDYALHIRAAPDCLEAFALPVPIPFIPVISKACPSSLPLFGSTSPFAETGLHTLSHVEDTAISGYLRSSDLACLQSSICDSGVSASSLTERRDRHSMKSHLGEYLLGTNSSCASTSTPPTICTFDASDVATPRAFLFFHEIKQGITFAAKRTHLGHDRFSSIPGSICMYIALASSSFYITV